MKPVSAHAVANCLLEFAWQENKQLDNMQLQKLVYIAHGYTLAILNQELYYDDTHAWQFGPVIRTLYNSLRKYGNGVVLSKLRTEDTLEDPQKIEIVRAVWEAYGHLSGPRLSATTHQTNTPWDQAWKKERYGIIPIDVIQPYYENLYRRMPSG